MGEGEGYEKGCSKKGRHCWSVGGRERGTRKRGGGRGVIVSFSSTDKGKEKKREGRKRELRAKKKGRRLHPTSAKKKGGKKKGRRKRTLFRITPSSLPERKKKKR